MIVELRQKAQITIPKEIVKGLSMKEGDQLDISEKDGNILMVPVVLCPTNYIEELKNEIQELKSNAADGRKPVFDQVDKLLKRIEKL